MLQDNMVKQFESKACLVLGIEAFTQRIEEAWKVLRKENKAIIAILKVPNKNTPIE